MEVRIFLALILHAFDVHPMVDIYYEGQISPKTAKYWVGGTISRTTIEESMANIEESKIHIGEIFSELKNRTEQDRINLGQNGNYEIFHFKNQNVKHLGTCFKKLEIVTDQVQDIVSKILPEEKKKRAALSQDTVVSLGTAIINGANSFYDYWKEREYLKKVENLGTKVDEVQWRLGGKIAKVGSDFEHFAENQVIRNNEANKKLLTLRDKTKEAFINITERIGSENEYTDAVQSCQDALITAEEVRYHLNDVQSAVLKYYANEPDDLFISARETREITEKFQLRTNQEAFFSPEDSPNLVEYAEFMVVVTEQGLILLAQFKIPAKQTSYSLYSITPVVQYNQDDDLFCKLQEVPGGLIKTDVDSFAYISKEQLSQCKKSNEITICNARIHFSSAKVESCGTSILSNASLSEVSRNCHVDCYKDDKPQIVDLKSGDYSVTVKSPTPYSKTCGFDPIGKHNMLDIGQSVIEVEKGCTVNLDSTFDLPGKDIELHDARYKEFQLETSNHQLKDVFESRKNFLKSDIQTVDEFGEFESIKDHNILKNDVKKTIFDKVELSPNDGEKNLYGIAGVAAGSLSLMISFVLALMKICGKNKNSVNENV